MTGIILPTCICCLFYSTAASYIRYQYVRSSLQISVQEVIKRNQFIYKSIFLVESLNMFNYVSVFYHQYGKTGVDKSPILLYQSCLDPWAKESTNI